MEKSPLGPQVNPVSNTSSPQGDGNPTVAFVVSIVLVMSPIPLPRKGTETLAYLRTA